MSEISKNLRHAVVALLARRNDAPGAPRVWPTDAEDRVFASRQTPGGEMELMPYLVVATDQESRRTEERLMTLPRYLVQVQCRISAVVAGPTFRALDDRMDDINEQIYDALLGDDGFLGRYGGLPELSAEKSVAEPAGSTVGVLSVSATLSVTWTPPRRFADDFDRVGVDVSASEPVGARALATVTIEREG